MQTVLPTPSSFPSAALNPPVQSIAGSNGQRASGADAQPLFRQVLGEASPRHNQTKEPQKSGENTRSTSTPPTGQPGPSIPDKPSSQQQSVSNESTLDDVSVDTLPHVEAEPALVEAEPVMTPVSWDFTVEGGNANVAPDAQQILHEAQVPPSDDDVAQHAVGRVQENHSASSSSQPIPDRPLPADNSPLPTNLDETSNLRVAAAAQADTSSDAKNIHSPQAAAAAPESAPSAARAAQGDQPREQTYTETGRSTIPVNNHPADSQPADSQSASAGAIREGFFREPDVTPPANVNWRAAAAQQTSPPASSAAERTDAAVAVQQDRSVDTKANAQASMPAFNHQSEDSSLLPAAARALQVETAVRLENATGQTAGAEQLDRPATQSIGSSQLANAAQAASTSASGGEANATSFTQHDADAESSPFASRIMRGLTAMINQRGGAMNMRLDPPELGTLRVQMTIARGMVAAEFHASTQQARALLDQHMTMLRTALENQGLTVDRLTVQLSQGQSQHFMRDDSNANAGDHDQRSHHDAAGGESRGRHEHSGDDQPPPRRTVSFASLFGSEAHGFSAALGLE